MLFMHELPFLRSLPFKGFAGITPLIDMPFVRGFRGFGGCPGRSQLPDDFTIFSWLQGTLHDWYKQQH